MSSQDKNLPYEILTLSHFGFSYCSVHGWVQLGLVGWMLLTKMAPDTFSQPHLRPRVDSVKMSCFKMVVRTRNYRLYDKKNLKIQLNKTFIHCTWDSN